MGVAFGKFDLQSRIAVGGMAEIFLAHVNGIEGFSKTLVLKRILPHLAEEQEFVRMFIDEAKLSATLTHPNIVQVHELGSIDGRYFIAMEYVAGIDLSTLTKRLSHKGALVPAGAVLTIVTEALKGLHYAHEKKDREGNPLGLVHRDVSPQNILLSTDGMTKITDFGIAKAAGKSTKTRSGVLKGKFSYMAPEQAFGRAVDRRADLFAMGLVAYELFSGKRAYKSDNDLEMLDMAREAKLPPLAQCVPGFSEAVSQVLAKAMAPQVDDRFATCAEFAGALARVSETLAQPYSEEQLARLVLDNEQADVSDAGISETSESQIVSVSGIGHTLTTPSSEVRSAANASAKAQAKSGTATKIAVALGSLGIAGIVGAFLTAQHHAGPQPPTVAPQTTTAAASIPEEQPSIVAQPAAAASQQAPQSKPVGAMQAAPASGYLMLNSKPWAYVYIDGKKLPGQTPFLKHRLSAGTHRVKLESPGAGRSEEFSVTIRAGQTEKKIFDFDH